MSYGDVHTTVTGVLTGQAVGVRTSAGDPEQAGQGPLPSHRPELLRQSSGNGRAPSVQFWLGYMLICN